MQKESQNDTVEDLERKRETTKNNRMVEKDNLGVCLLYTLFFIIIILFVITFPLMNFTI